MYSDVFCKVYNEFGWNYYPEVFGEQLLTWLRQHAVKPKTSLDLACGTGVLCQLLSSCGFAVIKCADRLLDEGNHGTTWFVIARKPQ